MRMLIKHNGYKNRKNAQRKLDDCELVTGPQSVGFVIANEDGTYSPVIWLLGNDLTVARVLASNGIHVLG